MLDFIKNIILATYKICLFCGGIFLVLYFSFQQYKNWDLQKNFIPPFVDDGVCNVAVIQISGTIGVSATDAQNNAGGQVTSSIPVTGDVDRVIHDLEYAKKSGFIKGIILQIDSYGGVGNAGQILLSYLDHYPIPVVSLIRDAGDSMAYWVALGGKEIIAYPGADVGSIGVNSSFLNSVEKDKKDGLKYISIVSGKYKDIGTPDKDLSKDDILFLQKQNDRYFDQFVDVVAEKRNMQKEDVKKIADGRSWISQDAKDLGLIDEIGDQETALTWLGTYLGASSTPVSVSPCAQY